MDRIYKHEYLDPGFPFKVKYAVMKPFYDMDRIFHWHNYLEISYVKQGEGIYHTEDGSYTMRKGDIIIINNIEPHYMEVLPPHDMIQPVLMIDPVILYPGLKDSFEYDYLAPFFHRTGSFMNKIDGNDPEGKEIYLLLESIVSEYNDKNRGYELMIKAKLLNVVTLLFRHYESSLSVSNETKKRADGIKRLEAALVYINKNSNAAISISDLAKLSYMNRTYFCSYFKDAMGVTPVWHINSVRIANAVRLLKGTDINISEIAMNCGYNNLSQFNRVFKKLTGKTPKQLRL